MRKWIKRTKVDKTREGIQDWNSFGVSDVDVFYLLICVHHNSFSPNLSNKVHIIQPISNHFLFPVLYVDQRI